MVCRVIILLELSEVPLFVPLARSVRIQLAMRVCCSVVCWRCRPQLGIAFRQIGAYYTCVSFCNGLRIELELELELIQTQMTQKPMPRAEVYARALRASQNRKENSV